MRHAAGHLMTRAHISLQTCRWGGRCEQLCAAGCHVPS